MSISYQTLDSRLTILEDKVKALQMILALLMAAGHEDPTSSDSPLPLEDGN